MMSTLIRSRKAKALAGLLFLAVTGPMCGGGGGGGGGASGGGGATFSVVAHTPVTGALSVARTATIYVTVNGVVNPATLAGNILLQGNPNPIPTTASYNTITSAIEIVPTTPMDNNFIHTLTLGAGVQTMGGASLNATSFTFRTVASTDTGLPTFTGAISVTAPTATTSMTVNWAPAGTDGVTPQASLLYEVYLATTVGAHNFANPPAATSAAGATSVLVNPLSPNTTYYVRVFCRDQAGNRTLNTNSTNAKTLVSFVTNIYNPIVNTICVACHKLGGISEFMRLDISAADTVTVKWVGIPADTASTSTQACQASGLTRVVATQPNMSLVYLKIIPNPQPCGVRMPEDGATNGYLSAPQIQLFFDWITEGANNN